MFQDEIEKCSKKEIIAFMINFAKGMDVTNKIIPHDQRLNIYDTLVGLSKESIQQLMYSEE